MARTSLFISHSRKDTKLVDLVRKSFPLADTSIVVYEDLAPAPSEGTPDAQRIKELIQGCKAVFLFHTPNVEASEFTKAWVQYEVSQASAHGKQLIVFQQADIAPKMPITFFTDVVPLSLDVPELVPNMQVVARSHVPRLRERPFVRASAGAAGGILLGPLGMGIGALIGFFTTPKSKLDEMPRLQCLKCKAQFRFWAEKGASFHCPSCLRNVTYQ